LVLRDGSHYAHSTFLNLVPTDEIVDGVVRFRTVGDMTCTAAMHSEAATVEDVIRENKASKHSERGARMDDRRSESAMEQRKKGGYF
jgi:sulfate adenylyltransferase subunit 2